MATKKITETSNGDLKANVIILRSVFGKVGQTYFIQPAKDKKGRWPDCVKRVDAHGDMILNDKERNSDRIFIPENSVFKYQDGKTFNLDDPYDAAEWEAVKNSDLIAQDRYEKDSNGNFLIDGTPNPRLAKNPRYGIAELYVYRPGIEAKNKMTKRRLITQAMNFIMNEEGGYDGLVAKAKVLGRDMTNQPMPDIEEFLCSIAEKTPEKIINCYTGGDMKSRILFVDAKSKNVIYKKNGLYLFGEDGLCILGATDDACIEWFNNPKNVKTVALIRKETYPDMFSE